jgi:predicted Rossmann-fold nucleotide-binding protein
VFIALPGGIGTLDEIFSTVASATIGYHSKKVILYNMKGFWNTLVSLLDDLQGKGFMRKEWRAQIMVANSLEEIAAILNDLT